MRGMITFCKQSQKLLSLCPATVRCGYHVRASGVHQGTSQSKDALFFACTSTTPDVNSTCSSAPLFALSSLKISEATASHNVIKKYELPSLGHNMVYKKSIVDPGLSQKVMELPGLTLPIQEKLTPSLERLVPIIDPSPLQRAIDEGMPPLEKYTMPYMLRIRHRKMKKHKLKKLRKRRKFITRKIKFKRMKLKELKIVEFEKNKQEFANNFDAEKFVTEKMVAAKRGNWTVDAIQRSKFGKDQKS